MNAHEGHAELLADRRVALGGVAHFEAVLERIAPFGRVGLRRVDQRLERLHIDVGIGRCAHDALVVGPGRRGRLGGIAGQHVPARSVLGVEIDRLGEIVDAGFALVGEVLVLQPEEALRHHEPGEGGAVLVLGDVAELLAERREARIGERRGQRDRNRLVGLDRSRRRRLEAARRQRQFLGLALR